MRAARDETGGTKSPTSLKDGRGAGPQHQKDFAAEAAHLLLRAENFSKRQERDGTVGGENFTTNDLRSDGRRKGEQHQKQFAAETAAATGRDKSGITRKLAIARDLGVPTLKRLAGNGGHNERKYMVSKTPRQDRGKALRPLLAWRSMTIDAEKYKDRWGDAADAPDTDDLVLSEDRPLWEGEPAGFDSRHECRPSVDEMARLWDPDDIERDGSTVRIGGLRFDRGVLVSWRSASGWRKPYDRPGSPRQSSRPKRERDRRDQSIAARLGIPLEQIAGKPSELFLAGQVAASGNSRPGAMPADEPRRSDVVALLDDETVTILDTALTAQSMAGLGMALGAASERQGRRSGEQKLFKATENLRAALKKLAS